MAREKMFDPDFQKAFTEAIHKENKIRRKWHMEYSSRPPLASDLGIDEESSDEEETAKEKPSPPATAKWPAAVTKEVEKPKKPVEPEAETSWPAQKPKASITRIADPPPVMRPVPADSKMLLYQGISHDGEGRAQYLRHRTRLNPEAKYRFPICSSWEYGWTYGQPTELLTSSEFGRRQIIKESFYRPKDPQLQPRP